jgi:hypothetical protein
VVAYRLALLLVPSTRFEQTDNSELMNSSANSTDDIKQRIRPILDKVAVAGLRAWLRTIGLSSSATTRPTITELVAKHIAEGRLAEDALEQALIGFEEASDMRIYLFRLDEVLAQPVSQWMPNRLQDLHIPIVENRTFAVNSSSPMSPVYAQIEGARIRIKWSEEQVNRQIDDSSGEVVQRPALKRAVLIADFQARTAELRLNPPENYHSYRDGGGHLTAEAYYNAYINQARSVLGCLLLPVELRLVMKKLVEDEDPRVIRIHIDNHTNQTNTRMKTNSSRADVRDDPDWKLAYEKNGDSWAWSNQSFYWLPKASSGFLARELFSHLDALEGFVKVNADCSDEEVMYVVSQIRAR